MEQRIERLTVKQAILCEAMRWVYFLMDPFMDRRDPRRDDIERYLDIADYASGDVRKIAERKLARLEPIDVLDMIAVMENVLADDYKAYPHEDDEPKSE